MHTLIEYTATNGRCYALRAEQIRGLDGNQHETRVLATIGGVALTFRVRRPYREVMDEWKKEIERGGEEPA